MAITFMDKSNDSFSQSLHNHQGIHNRMFPPRKRIDLTRNCSYRFDSNLLRSLSHAKIALKTKELGGGAFIARAATRNMLIRVRDGTRESDTHTYLTRACLGA